MKHIKMIFSTIRQAGHWMLLLLAANLMLLFITWLLRPDAFAVVSFFAFLFFFLILICGLVLDYHKRQKQKYALQNFINDPCEKTALSLEAVCEKSFHPYIRLLLQNLTDQNTQINTARSDLLSYREMIEEWAHEIKTPLSLTTLVLDNHKDEMSPYIYKRMEHVRHTIGSDVEKILFYARSQADHADFRFEPLDLMEIVQEALLPFEPLADEQRLQVQVTLLPIAHPLKLQVVSDRKVFLFVLSQLLNNAFKYAAKEKGQISITCFQEDTSSALIHLQIRDNGCGVPAEDAPFIFDKGFTGSHPGQQHATGIGLYLVQKYADALSLKVQQIDGLSSETSSGFGIEVLFPAIQN